MSTHTAISYHIVFSTKDRRPVLRRDRREDLFRYIWGIIKNRQSHLYRINGVEDHLHILSSLHPSVSLADFVKDVKTGSALGIKQNSVFKRFSHWQEGYAGLTCSQRDIDDRIEYLQGQEEPHRKTPFEEEYRNLLVEAGIAFDERYML